MIGPATTLLDRMVMRAAGQEGAVEPPLANPFEPVDEDVEVSAPKVAKPAPATANSKTQEPPRLALQPEPVRAMNKEEKRAAPEIPERVVTRTIAQPRMERRSVVQRVSEPYAVNRIVTLPGQDRIIKFPAEPQVVREASHVPERTATPEAIQPDLKPEVLTRPEPRSSPADSRDITVNVTIGRLEIHKAQEKSRVETKSTRPRENAPSLQQFLASRRSSQ